MASGGKRSTTWSSGSNPRMKKGTRHRSTKLKEAFGVSNWNDLTKFVEGPGLERLTMKMFRLRPKEYCTVFLALTEFVKPKLQRTTHATDPGKPVELTVQNSSNLSREELLKFLEPNGK